MAFDLLRSAKHIRGLSHAEFRVLFYLLDSANQDTYECYPSLKNIAAHTDMAPRTVQRHISALAERGLFEKIEQRRSDGSRAVNCYRFHAVGTMKIGREMIVQLGVDVGTDPEQQHANSGTLDNRPIVAGGDDSGDVGSRQSRQDIDQESEPVIGTTSPDGDDGRRDLFGRKIDDKAVVIQSPSVIDFVRDEWAKLKHELGDKIADCRAITESQARLIRERSRQHARENEGSIDVWRLVFAEIRRSRFLRGEAPPGFGRQKRFRLSLSDLLKPHIFTKVVNGKYADTEADEGSYDPHTGEILSPANAATRGTIELVRAARERGGR